MASAMNTSVNMYICSGCEAGFDYDAHERVFFGCPKIEDVFKNKDKSSALFKKTCYPHALCLSCVRQQIRKQRIITCPACNHFQEISFEDASVTGNVTWYGYLEQFGMYAWNKILHLKKILNEFSDEIDANIHPLAIELSGLLG